MERRALSVLCFAACQERQFVSPFERQFALIMEKKKKKISNDPKVSTAKSSGHAWVIPADSPLSFHHTKSQFNLMFMHLLCKKHQGPRCESQNHRLATVCVASSHPHSRAQIRNFEYLTESGVLYNPNSFIMNKLLFSVRPYSLQVYFFTSSVLL